MTNIKYNEEKTYGLNLLFFKFFLILLLIGLKRENSQIVKIKE